MKNAIIVTGNPVDGFTFIGPFMSPDSHDSGAAARDYAGDGLNGLDWWIAPTITPERHVPACPWCDGRDGEHRSITREPIDRPSPRETEDDQWQDQST